MNYAPNYMTIVYVWNLNLNGAISLAKYAGPSLSILATPLKKPT